MVIATDMALHFDYVNKFKELVSQENPDASKDETKVFLMWMCLHISDLTNPSKLWPESNKWTCLVYEEFFVQGDKEKELGLPVGNLNDRCNINIAKSQIGFINFIVLPSFDIYSKFLPKVTRNVEQLKTNIEHWNEIVQEWEELKESGNDLIKRFQRLEAKEEEEEEKSIKEMRNDSNKRTADIQEAADENHHSEGKSNHKYSK
jgi:hypothetical protein